MPKIWFIFLIARIYLGMHSLTDVVAGIGFGLVILEFWIMVHGYIDDFIVNGQNGKQQYVWCRLSIGSIWFKSLLSAYWGGDNVFQLVCVAVTSFSATLSLLLCLAYPTPELPTPSFDFHAAFTGVAFGIVSVFHFSLINEKKHHIVLDYNSLRGHL